METGSGPRKRAVWVYEQAAIMHCHAPNGGGGPNKRWYGEMGDSRRIYNSNHEKEKRIVPKKNTWTTGRMKQLAVVKMGNGG